MNIFDPTLVRAELEKPIILDDEELYYTLVDRWVIAREVDRLYNEITNALPKKTPRSKKRFYLTAGGPGAGKTTLIRRAQKMGGPICAAAHIDPDEILRDMKPYQEIITFNPSDEGRTGAYIYWRWASIYVAQTIINRLADAGYDIVYGTTGTNAAGVKAVYAAAKAAGYETTAIMCHAAEETRLAGVAERFDVEKRFTPEVDVINKGNKLFPEVVSTHFALADHVQLYWRDREKTVLAAEAHEGRVTEQNMLALTVFIAELKRHKPDFDWVAVVNAYEGRGKKKVKISPQRQP